LSHARVHNETVRNSNVSGRQKNMLTYRRRIPGQEEEVISIPENTDEPIDLSQDPDDTEYSVDSFEAYKEFVKRVKLE
jgi:hypothetical protein